MWISTGVAATPRLTKRGHNDQPPTDTRLIGYARVSTPDQSLDMQLEALRAAGVLDRDLYFECVSGAAKRRPKLALAMMGCERGDTLLVWKLDRFARSLRDLLNKLEVLEQRGVGFRSLTDSIDMGTSSGRLLTSILGAVAQFERDLIAERTRTGVKLFMERGGKMGRAPLMTAERFGQADTMIRAGETIRAVAKACGVVPGTIYSYYSGDMISAMRDEGPLRKTKRT